MWRRALSQALVLLQVARSRNWARTQGLGPFPGAGKRRSFRRWMLLRSPFEYKRAGMQRTRTQGHSRLLHPLPNLPCLLRTLLKEPLSPGQVSCGIGIGCSLVTNYFKLLHHHVQLHPTRIRLRPPPIHCFEMVRRLQDHTQAMPA